MRFLSAYLASALSLLGLAQASMKPPGYDRFSLGDIDSVLLFDEDQNYHLVEVIKFHPWMKAATIYFVDEDIQPKRGSRLGLTESYNVLAEARKRDPKDIDWIITEVTEDWETEDLIRDIRESRGIGPTDEFVVVPGDLDWDAIFDTKYRRYASLVNHKEIDRVLVRTVERGTPGAPLNSECFYFYFPAREAGSQQDQTTPAPANDKQDEGPMSWEEVWKKEWTDTQEGEETKAWVEKWISAEDNELALEGLLAEEEVEEAISLSLMYHKIAEWTSNGE